MNREYHKWHSAALGREMELLVFGRAGARVVAFPTSMGRFYDWEDRGLVGSIREHLEQGWVQLICIDSVDGESWYAKDRPPAERAARQGDYERYVIDEVLPFSEQRNPNPFVIFTGASFGAYHAVNLALRRPDRINRTIGMSGLYDIKRFADGYFDDNVYFNSPCDYIRHEHDPERLNLLRHLDIILVTGRDDANRANNEHFSQILWGKNIPHALRIWDGWAHDWPYWEQMLPLYLSGAD